MKVVLGIDIGGTNTEYGLVDRSGAVHYAGKVKTRAHPTAAALASKIAKALEPVLEDMAVQAIGIGAPNGNYYNGSIEFAPNLVWKGVVPLAEVFERQFSIPVAVTNDANAAALGEMLFGAAKGLRDFIAITLGTGLGSGFVCNGEVLYGHTGMAGELGHVVIHPEGRDCKCGRRGCLERYASSTGFMITVRELLDGGSNSILATIPAKELHAKDVDKAAKAGDTLALKAFDITARALARGLATASAITSPEAIVLCGGLARSGNLLVQPTKKYLEAELLQIYRGTIDLKVSGIPDGNVAILGAGALGWKATDR